MLSTGERERERGARLDEYIYRAVVEVMSDDLFMDTQSGEPFLLTLTVSNTELYREHNGRGRFPVVGYVLSL